MSNDQNDTDLGQDDQDQEEDEMICALTADEQTALQRGLRGLPQTMPPRDVWLRIREQAEAEGLLRQSPRRRPHQWYAGAGLAAAALLVAVMLPGGNPPVDTSTVVPPVSTAQQAEPSNLQLLQVQSRQLEQDLRAMPDEPRVARAGTVATISEIENRIAAIDYQLNDAPVSMTDDDREIFWRERVRLMKLLLQLRYAQAQRAAY